MFLCNRLDDLRAYDALLIEPALFLDFVKTLVKQDRIDNLLQATLQLRMEQQVAQLLQLYFKHWPDRTPSVAILGDPVGLIKVHLVVIWTF